MTDRPGTASADPGPVAVRPVDPAPPGAAAGYLDPHTIRRLADAVGLTPSRGRGQNFVHDANIVRRIVGLAEVGPDDTVMEVGAGLGSLTLGLLHAGGTVVAVEIEPTLARRLPQTVADFAPDSVNRLTIIESDALQLRRDDPRLAAVPGRPNALVANLPYNIAVPVILHVLAEFTSIDRALVMVQREVADRLTAAPGSRVYGVPSAKLAWYGSARRLGTVAPTVFWPVPQVDSGLVGFVRQPRFDPAGRAAVFAVIDAAFAQRRKMLRSALAARYPAPAVNAALESAGIDPRARGETLAIDDFVRLAAHLA